MICNAVRVVADDRRRWVTDPVSIDEYGRFEETLPVGDVPDDATLEALGNEHLAQRAGPVSSIVAEINADGIAVRTGGLHELDGDEARIVAVSRTLGPGGWVTLPTYSTSRQEAAVRRGRQLDKMIATAGGGSPLAAAVKGSRTRVPTGKLVPEGDIAWTFFSMTDEDEDPWQEKEVKDFCRLYAFAARGDFATVHADGSTGPVHTTGPTHWQFSVNGSTWLPVPLIQGALETAVEVPLFGYSFLKPGDLVRVWPTLRGGHTNGSVTLFYTARV